MPIIYTTLVKRGHLPTIINPGEWRDCAGTTSPLGVVLFLQNKKNDANESIGPRDGNKVRGTGKLLRLV
jgi:hypothetical protein